MKVVVFSLSPFNPLAHNYSIATPLPGGCPIHMEIPTADRRTTLKAIGALAGSGLALGGLSLAGSERASAEVSADFTVPDGTYKSKSGDLYTPWLQATGEWSYDSLEVDPDEWRVTLRAGATADNQDALTTVSGIPFGFDAAQSFAMQVALIDAGAFASTDFEAADGQTVDVTVHASVLFEVIHNGEVIIDATASDSGLLTVEDTSLTYNASVTGTGSWEYQANSTDPTPTPP